jgi:hypothetical protein
MAEKQIGVDGDVVANRPSNVDVVSGSAAELISNAPAPSDKAGKVYRVLYPTDHFVMEGMPVVTSGGTPLTDAQAKQLLPVAEASGVKIEQVSE